MKDFELVLFLIASHHGHARPFFRPAVDAAPVIVNLKHGDLQLAASTDHQLYRYSAGTAERFTGLVNRYGWHRLALMEALVRLADHRASEMEARS